MNLRDVCQQVAARSVPVEIRWHELSRSVAAIERQWADVPVRTPSNFELEPIYHRVATVWKKERALEGLSTSELRRLPYVLFFPETEPGAWLGADVELGQAALRHIRKRPSALKVLLHNVLKVWPDHVPEVARLGLALARELARSTSLVLAEWRRRVEFFGLLSLDGPAKVAQMLRERPRQRDEILASAGLTGELGLSRFVARVEAELRSQLEQELSEGDYGSLETVLNLHAPNGELTFRQHAPALAETLLMSFIDRNPPGGIQEQIRTFLLTHLKDPRLTRSGWASVRPAAKDVMLRWMVGATLEDFFRLISRWAEEKHWTYRRAFWAAYLKKGHISQAWVVLGDSARQEALRRWAKAVPDYARFLRGHDPNHCVLLLKIGSLTIAEWSHNGTCRVWADGSEDCPKMYMPGYFRDELRRNPDYEQRHHGNLQFTWQWKLANVIFQETGIRMMQVDYVVR
jgi:hypothetical protein